VKQRVAFAEDARNFTHRNFSLQGCSQTVLMEGRNACLMLEKW
jgi:hypothetical protein